MFTLKFEVDDLKPKGPGLLMFGGQIRLFGIPPPLPAFAIVRAEMASKIEAQTTAVIWPFGVRMKTWGPVPVGASFPFAEFAGKLDIRKGGNYQVWAEVYPTPLAIGPPMAKSTKIPVSVALVDAPAGTKVKLVVPITMEQGGEADYNVICRVFEGNILSAKLTTTFGFLQGQELASYSKTIHFKPQQRQEITFEDVAISAPNMKRDVIIDVLAGDQFITGQAFDDVYYVP